MSSARCALCNLPVPVSTTRARPDGRGGRLHVSCDEKLRTMGWEYGRPIPPRELVGEFPVDPPDPDDDAAARDFDREPRV